jgi:hypothetical protein
MYPIIKIILILKEYDYLILAFPINFPNTLKIKFNLKFKKNN